MLHFTCPKCGSDVDVDGHLKGEKTQCARCGNHFVVSEKGCAADSLADSGTSAGPASEQPLPTSPASAPATASDACENTLTENRFNIPKIKSLYFQLGMAEGIYLILFFVSIFMLFQNPGAPLPLFLRIVWGIELLYSFVVWIMLWIQIKKSRASIAVHAICAFWVFFLGGAGFILYLLLMLIASSQAKAVLKHNGDVDVTFFAVKPRKKDS